MLANAMECGREPTVRRTADLWSSSSRRRRLRLPSQPCSAAARRERHGVGTESCGNAMGQGRWTSSNAYRANQRSAIACPACLSEQSPRLIRERADAPCPVGAWSLSHRSRCHGSCSPGTRGCCRWGPILGNTAYHAPALQQMASRATN